MAKKKKAPERKQIEVRIDVDHERLYGPIDGAIQYLQEMRDQHQGTGISLDEHWTGYEDMYMTLVYWRDETDEEFQGRLELEEMRRRLDEEEKRRAKERAKDVEEFQRLKAKLGIR
jgi:hypothetical protein